MSKHIYIYSPSGAVRDKAAFKRGIQRLKALGPALGIDLEVEVDETALASQQRFAGDDATRLAAIRRAAASGADVALITRGGYGLTRILPDLPMKQIHKAIERGTAFVGLSDFTAFQLAVLAHASGQEVGITWAGPALLEAFGGAGDPDEITQACFEDLLLGQGEGTGWRLPKTSEANKAAAGAWQARRLGDTARIKVEHAPLWGGNLAVLVSLLGTPYFPSPMKTEGGLLFLEDVGEHPYRIERMLTQLLHAGVLGRQQAILLGHFTDYKLTPHDKGYTLQSVVNWLRSQLKVPVLTGLPFGHVPTKVLLPVGACCDLLVEGRDALLVWGHAHGHADHAH
ncbi:muramoyltetrapeptide carboxypeptidase [Hylemonella gracilis str. Niagara R]|uniref:Muramoyltetrapeptide carboxypeptidase n=1 Tax=Hylemonella gracilis str. Niagara R TaxID=1458275 RepID=A0A016XHQ0_9BURK|nr:LD-carboxypeptidase [Hylemonella gracilis]EYC51435.1 muramoyltetrapeptide carboxypeptidase [Hylemonella gracilis str. Niagara R]